MKTLTIRQKHIKIADRSDLSWATVKHYMADPLADGPEDEKDIARLEKEALKEQERANVKKAPKRGGGRFRKPRQDYQQQSYRFEPYNDFGRRERFAPPPPMPQRQFRPRVLGPCFHCGAYSHSVYLHSTGKTVSLVVAACGKHQCRVRLICMC